MSLGNKISKIRKDNNLTQEAFAEKYNVTRQTISSWENSKSYPDLDTLVKISDDFSISLDVLLKEDKKVIENISKSQKESKLYKGSTIVLIIILMFVIIVVCGYYGVRGYSKSRLIHQFEVTVKENNFYKDENGIYKFDYKKGIFYEVLDQNSSISSGYNFRFFARPLYCYITVDDNYLLLSWTDYNYYEAELVNKKTNEIIKKVDLLGTDNRNQISTITENIDIDESILKDAIDKGNELYKQFYN